MLLKITAKFQVTLLARVPDAMDLKSGDSTRSRDSSSHLRQVWAICSMCLGV